MISIRLATRDDVVDLQRVAIETQVDTFGAFNTKENMDAFIQDAYSLENLERELLEPGSMNYLAMEGTELAGFLRLRLTDEAKPHLGPNTIELQRLYVLKKYHGQKIGAMLIREALSYASSKGFEWIWLGVWERNFKAQEFYWKWGFERFSEHIFHMGSDPQTDWLLKLRLSPIQSTVR